MNIFVVGMPGSGKSTLGKILAEKLKRTFCDMDGIIECEQKRTISRIFEEDGEPSFRAMESLLIQKLSQKNEMVAATGGGAPLARENVENMKRGGAILFINRPLEQIIGDIATEGRPLLKGGRDRLYALYEQRFHIYKSCADIELINDGTPDEAICKAVEEVQRYEAAHS